MTEETKDATIEALNEKVSSLQKELDSYRAKYTILQEKYKTEFVVLEQTIGSSHSRLKERNKASLR